MALAYFELKNTDMNCLNKGESEEFSNRRVVLSASMLRIQGKDTGMFAATTRSDASVFWYWPTSVVPPVLVERFVGESTMEPELMEFELTLLMLTGELRKLCNDALCNACMAVSPETREKHL